MARYAEWNKFIGGLKRDKYGNTNVNEIGIAFERATADVAPKSEVAREIFEEIKREFNGAYYYKGYTIERYIAELKKKYTEEKE